MQDTLYLLLEQNIEVKHPHVYLQDIAKLSCSNPEVLDRIRILPVITLEPEKPGRYVLSVMELVRLIQQKEPELTVTPMGETTFIITYKSAPSQNPFRKWGKVFFVCLATFFGSAFSIMTFNNDVDLGGLFQKIYFWITGKQSDGFTVLEISYSIGIGLGILFFFNHFGKLKFTDDPTPMQIQMRTYEDDVNNTLIEDAGRFQNQSEKS